MAKDPQAVAQDWAAKLGASTEKISRGVDAVTVSPGQAASRQADVWAQNTAAAKNKFASATARVTLSDWQAAMKNKGVQRIGAGAQASVPKMAAFLTQFLPFVETTRRSLPPRGNLDANLNRMMANARAMAQFKRSGH